MSLPDKPDKPDKNDRRFPNESDDYRGARDELLKAEADLRTHIEKVAEQRRKLPLSGKVKEDYVFERVGKTGSTGSVRLSDLFSPGKNTLAVYSYMYGPTMEAPCPMCTSIIDGFDAEAPHVRDRINMVVVAKSPIERIMDFAQGRHWNRIPLLSSNKNSYNADYWAEDAEGNQMPMLNVFVKKDDDIYHFWGSELLYGPTGGETRHVDALWPLWNLFDLTPEGRGTDWYPKLSYE